MYFTEGELRPYEQLMRQTPRRPMSNKKDKKPTTPTKTPSPVNKKEKPNGNH